MQQRIALHKEKVQRLIGEWEAYLATLDPEVYQCRQDYLRAMSLARNKLPRLKGELLAMEESSRKTRKDIPYIKFMRIYISPQSYL